MTSQPTPGEVLNGEIWADWPRSTTDLRYEVNARPEWEPPLCPCCDNTIDQTCAVVVIGGDALHLAHDACLPDECRPQPSGGQDGGGETSEPVPEPAFAMVWLNKGPYPAALIDDLNGYITGGSTRCLDALSEHGVDVMRRTPDAALASPAKATGWPSWEAIRQRIAEIVEAAIERHAPTNSVRHTLDDADAILALFPTTPIKAETHE